MALQNIGASNAGDDFYRYKMPVLVSKIEGRGNGIKTNIVNMVDVAKALGRPASYTTKFFGCELGAQSKFEEKSGLAIVNGAHEQKKLSGMLEGFIKRFVQCGECGNPETIMEVTKNETVIMVCKACGAMTNVDMRHKLTTFILRNPPEKSSKNEKKLRRAEKERLEEGEKIDREEKERRKAEKKEKKEKSKKEKKGKGGESSGEDGAEEPADSGPEEEDDDDVQWTTDVSAEAQAKRAAELSSAAARLVTEDVEKKLAVAGGDDEEDEEEEEEEEDPLVVELRKTAVKGSPTETAAKLKSLATKGPQHSMYVLVEAMLDEEKGAVAEQVKAAIGHFQACVTDAALQGHFLAALEHFVSNADAKVCKKLPAILQVLYDDDVAEEEAIMAWFGAADAAKKFGVEAADAAAVRKAAKPFVEWLQEADEDED
mmetsp:Transcript_15819/g.51823  ORF Transcript_15819/g.51823 Transcript_15819/m.51823 type:complete len:429 (+) Transcript_15819:101-1387(+)